jgi:hypothetical protein
MPERPTSKTFNDNNEGVVLVVVVVVVVWAWASKYFENP